METFETVAVAVLVIGFVTYRQTRWVPVKLSKLLRMPVIFAVAGALQIPSSLKQLPRGWHLDALDVAVISGELVLALVVGWLMGRMTEIANVRGVTSSRLGGWGIAVWLIFIAVRIGLGVVASAWSAPLAALPVTVFFVVAAVKLAQLVVVRERLAIHHRGHGQTVEQNQPAANGQWR
jgi:hypothetical protein